jgi:hypothetical protein
MSQPDEFLLKQMLEKEAAAELNRDCFGSKAEGGLGYCDQAATSNLCASPSLDEQIKNLEYRTQYDREELNRLRELKFLLEKNPETGRILKLLRLQP